MTIMTFPTVEVHFTQILSCHHPRNRMIQYSPALKICNGSDYWMPACAGMTFSSWEGALSGGMLMSARTWTVAEAKAKFSELLERARAGGPQTITRNGRTAAVVVSAEEWERKTRRKGNLAEFFAASPLRGSGLMIKRSKDKARDVKL
jgi:prevent-host-death family protein